MATPTATQMPQAPYAARLSVDYHEARLYAHQSMVQGRATRAWNCSQSAQTEPG